MVKGAVIRLDKGAVLTGDGRYKPIGDGKLFVGRGRSGELAEHTMIVIMSIAQACAGETGFAVVFVIGMSVDDFNVEKGPVFL